MDPDIHRVCTGTDYDDLAPGAIYGVRSFRVDELGNLNSIGYSHMWKPGVNESECPYTTLEYISTGHAGVFRRRTYKERKYGRCTSPDHGCGFWAYHDGTHYPYGNVTGVVKAWGRTTIGTKGFRAEFAEIVAICATPPPQTLRRKSIMEGYGVIVLFGTWFFILPALLGWFHSAVWAGFATPALAALIWSGLLVYAKHADRLQARYLWKKRYLPLREKFPDVAYYTDYREMLKDFPPSYALGDLSP